MRGKLCLIGLFAYWLITYLPAKQGLFLSTPVYAQKNAPPVLSIASPHEGDTILGDRVTFSFIVGNFTFVDFNLKKTNAPNEGHIHLWLDQKNPTIENANEILSHEDVFFQNLPPGNHILITEVVQNDHSSFKPKIITTIHFHTQLPLPSSPPSPTPEFILLKLSQKLTREQLFIADGLLLFFIGLVIFIIFGRKKFFP